MASIDTGEEIVVFRPEIPIRVYGPKGHIDVMGLVDTGADNSIFPLAVARNLGIETVMGTGPGATAFGGQQIPLSSAEVVIAVSDQDGSAIRWRAHTHFADDLAESTVILGHEGFLDFFNATFCGDDAALDLAPRASAYQSC
ncbi:MAG: hypothetical protein JSS02_12130 [Planctomycetes bacterium]|nr:hypothetical protein [Planctomycetota bacterium]